MIICDPETEVSAYSFAFERYLTPWPRSRFPIPHEVRLFTRPPPSYRTVMTNGGPVTLEINQNMPKPRPIQH